jgi:hypothetical protein
VELKLKGCPAADEPGPWGAARGLRAVSLTRRDRAVDVADGDTNV